MMKKKLKVSELRLKSFVTSFKNVNGQTIKGGGVSQIYICRTKDCDGNNGGYDCPGSDSCEDGDYWSRFNDDWGCTGGGGC